MVHRYAEFAVEAGWFNSNAKRFMLEAGGHGMPVYMRLQGEHGFSIAQPALPSDRLNLLATLEAWGWEVMSVNFGEDYMLILARRKIYEAEVIGTPKRSPEIKGEVTP